jgi:nucleoid DNA-binding protein
MKRPRNVKKIVNRSDIAKKATDKIVNRKLTRRNVTDAYFDAMFEIFTETNEEMDMTIRGLGIFKLRLGEGYHRFDVVTRKISFIPPSIKIKFTPYKKLKLALRETAARLRENCQGKN